MSNVLRKIRRNMAQAHGLPRGYYGKTMQRKIANVNAAIKRMNKLIEEQQEDIVDLYATANAMQELNESEELSSEEKIPDGEESDSDIR